MFLSVSLDAQTAEGVACESKRQSVDDATLGCA